MKKYVPLLILYLNVGLFSQNRWFYMLSFWEVGGQGMAFNIESFDINKDGNLDVILGNWNNTYVYYGGYGILDTIKDLVYTGRMLAICDYNGDGYKDMIAMHFTSFDSSIYEYNGELLFYWGTDTGVVSIDTIADFSIPLPTLYPTFERFSIGNFTVGVQKGDLNGDGKADLIVGSTNSVDSIGINSGGKIYIYMGKDIPSDTADFVLIGQNVRAYIGDFMQVGNINSDNYDDLLFSSNQPKKVGIAYDSLNYLHIFYGSENFSALEGNESELYSSFVKPQDSTAGWFIREFSVDDIDGDGIDDIVVGRSFYNYPHISTVHYGSTNGIDTIPSFTFIQDTTNLFFFSAGGITQDVGDYNMDGYDDFIMSPAGYQQFALQLGGPHVNNQNRYGERGYSNGNDIFPEKGVNMGDQTNDGVNDIAVIANAAYQDRNGYALMLYGQNIPTEVKSESAQVKGFNLYQNYPNPFNSSTIINYQLTINSFITLKLYDILGKEITTLINEKQPAGEHKIEFDAAKYKLSSGVYFFKIVLTNSYRNKQTQTKSMVLIK